MTALCCLAALPWIALASDAEPVRFREQVAPILVSRCLACHQDDDAQGGLNMSSFALLREGGDIEGDLILLPGEPEASHLVSVLKPDAAIRMPLKQEPLTDDEIELIARWVAEGAVFDGPSEDVPLTSLVDPLAHLPKVEVTAEVADPVSAVSYAPDGSRLAAARGSDIFLFDADCSDPTALLEGHEGGINALIFSPDGQRLVAVGGRPGLFGTVAVWRVETGERLGSWKGHADAILSAALSPDGAVLATASYDRIVTLWNLESGDEIRSLREHTDAVYALAFSPDGTKLASASGDRTVKLWETESGRRLESLGDATEELYAVTFADEGATLIAAGADRTIRRWTLAGDSGTLDRSAIAHDGAVLDLLVTPDGSSLISTGDDGTVKRWSLAELAPLDAWPRQPDWPLAAALDPSGTQLALGRYDGALVLLPGTPESTGEDRIEVSLLDPPATKAAPSTGESEPKKETPQLVRRPSLGPPSPKGAERGRTVTVDLAGTGVGQANAVVFDDPRLVATIVPSEAPDPNRLRISVSIEADAPIGPHLIRVQTPLGVPAAQAFAVYAAPEAAEEEPNRTIDEAKTLSWPTTLAGTIETPGDVDHVRFSVARGQTVVCTDRGGMLGSALDPALELRNESGQMVGQGRSVLSYRADTDELLMLRIADRQFGGSGNHFYRIEIGEIPRVEDVFPLGVPLGGSAELSVSGANLGESVVSVSASSADSPGTLRVVPATDRFGREAEGNLKVVVAEGTQRVEQEPNDEPCCGRELEVPGGLSGRIDHEGDIDHVTINARFGQPLMIEVFGHRLGTEIDPILEILDAEGKPVPLAVLRPVARTAVAFRDHDATQDRIRLTRWDELAQDDYVLIGRELTRLFALPRNPDDDAVFWSAGGRRLSYLGTTPEQHPQDQPIDKVEIHPPGTTFPAGGAAPITLVHRNDDAPGLGKDAAIRFDPPRDGTYQIRVSDARGLGGPGFGYHLVAREPHPDFAVTLRTEHPDIPRGGATVIPVNVQRIDGFNAPIDLRVEGLPKGIRATSARVEAGHMTADLLLMADHDAPTFSSAPWQVVAEAARDGSSGELIRHDIRPGGNRSSWITVTPEPDLRVSTDRDRVIIRPGDRVELTFRVDRSASFSGRVPIDVRNLPHGVRVLNIGLNGVLITESQTERTVFLYAEPWVSPTERPFFGVGRVEAAGTEHSTPPITLVIAGAPSEGSSGDDLP
ncbi:c-type cytochrome domain-containing protein [Tautonia rosea]|uniref:c-type cytochrome domain-containing protein n=1 Tax=Tautonia rosea TaxID=2728037 RepID=UPI001473D98C|nr:c-type cytochrome domain-containing protein [Tautonia rosea]